ncbi:MAG: NUMOD4 motif-containing HNH endonuclease [Selenomonadaceae bacterium]|nr:NUMOD4 motif-containing HNH endonuclease [Selenomonadaceae bacterium]
MTVDEAKKILLAATLSPLEQTALRFLILELDSSIKDLPGEEWRNITDDNVNYGGKYQVSNFTRIRSLYRGKVRIIKPDIIHTGYLRVTLYKDGKTKSYYVHVLVAKAFIPNPENKPCVNHRDGNKQNNAIDNLEWVTQSENARHAYETGLRKSGCEHGRAKLTAEQVREIRRDCIPGDLEKGLKAFARKFNVTPRVIRFVFDGESYKDVE